jgi:hypothetical protein
MQVTALAEVVMSARRSDGVFSLQDLQLRLSRVGLEEFARAVAALRERAGTKQEDAPSAFPTWT